MATSQTEPSWTQPAAPERFSGKAVPLRSMLLSAFISSSISGTEVAVSKRARLPQSKAFWVEAWSARLTMRATRLVLSRPERYCTSTSMACGVRARKDSALAGAICPSKVTASRLWAP